MEQRTEMTELLDMMIQPGFLVRDGVITRLNAATRQLLLEPGTEIRSILAAGAEEYDAFTGGCLYLQLNAGGRRWGAAVVSLGEGQVFLVDPEPDSRELYALALAAQDLRSPLSNVLIAADQIASSDDPAIREQAGRLNRGLHQLMRTINNMSDALLYTRLSQQEVRNLTQVFAEIFEKANALLSQAGLVLHYEGPEEDIYAPADVQQLERAVLNILSNAAKFSPADAPIAASLARRGDTLRLSITDSGPGIAREILPNIFHRYLRQPGIEDSRFGLGLGMALIRTAAMNHGGTVLIDQPDGCTRITMTMALGRDREPMLRSPGFQVDYAGGRDHALLELSQTLPAGLYEKQK